jgi:DNA-directed RNA polymerase specialized sigma24 family protein
LPVGQREAILLCFEGFNYAEIAVVLGISASAAMSRCQRAKRTLRALVDKPPRLRRVAESGEAGFSGPSCRT